MCFMVITGEGPFIIGFKGLEQGDGEEPPVFMKVELGVEILKILRGVWRMSYMVTSRTHVFSPMLRYMDVST